jgi:hypothetical protein
MFDNKQKTQHLQARSQSTPGGPVPPPAMAAGLAKPLLSVFVVRQLVAGRDAEDEAWWQEFDGRS